ncbi:hypothetical protein BGZ94_009630 [Podila epigama]|nr:hypothetical protein BGZ94_009630 [Podila epigama]
MWRFSTMQPGTLTTTSSVVLRLSIRHPQSTAIVVARSSSATGPSRHFSGSRTRLNNSNNNSNNASSNGNSNNGQKKQLGERVVIDDKTRMRMDLRKQAMGANSNGAASSGGGRDKWAAPPNWDPTSPGPYRRAYDQAQNNSASGFRSNNNNHSRMAQQQGQEGQKRAGRYYEQARMNVPSSFMTSSFGFSAPKPSPKPPASSTPLSQAIGATPVSKPANGNTKTHTHQSAPKQQNEAIKGNGPASAVNSTPSSTTSTSTMSQQTSSGTTVPPTAQKASSTTTSTTTQPSSLPSQTTTTVKHTVATPTFTKSPNSAKVNARKHIEQRSKKRKERAKPPKDVFIPDAINVSNLAGLLGARMGHFEKTMKAMGMEITRHDHVLTSEEASLLALEYNVNPIVGSQESLFDLTPKPALEDMSMYPLRPPVVTIMGHVDHGKTTLLDSLRKTSVAAGEAGGITQHIGAFSVLLPSKQRITFLDTPGHAAFSAMRARGAHTTDIVVLVVAAEDGVMPQTAEAIKHAEEAGVPIIVAINKCDKYGADPEKAKQALLQHGLVVEDLGGETQCIEVSGLTGKNLDKLEEAILTLAEVLDLRAEVNMKGEGHVIESQIEKGRGNVATVLVKRGTLKVGDTIVAGEAWCKVRALVNDTGKNVKEAPPGTPVKVMGWKDLPKAGDEMLGAESEEQAKQAVTTRLLKKERQEHLKTLMAINEKRRILAEEEDEEKMAIKEHKRKAWLFHQGILEVYPEAPQPKRLLSVAAMTAKEEEQSTVKNLRMVVKGDVSGTVEAVCDAISGLPSNQVKVSVIQSGVGNISEGDIQFASSCSAMVLGFNVKADKKLLQTAKQLGVGVKSYGVIYKLLDEVKIEMAMLLPKDIEIQVVGEAKISQVFGIKQKGGATQNVAGCRILNGGVSRKEDVRIVRDGEIIWDGKLSTLKRAKDDIQEAKKGTECGMEFEGFQDFEEGDVIQSIKKTEVLRKL